MDAGVVSLEDVRPGAGSTAYHGREGVRTRRHGRYAHGPLLTFALVNIAGASLVAAAWFQGWTDLAFADDRTGLTLVIAGTFLGGLGLAGLKLLRLAREIACAEAYDPCETSWASNFLREIQGRSAGSRAISGSALRLRVAGSIASVRHVAGSLVILGLIGTVVGFIIAMSGVDPEVAGNVDAISPMVAALISGMSVALYTTLLGAGLNLWLMINHHILSRAAERLVLDLVALGESRARS